MTKKCDVREKHIYFDDEPFVWSAGYKQKFGRRMRKIFNALLRNIAIENLWHMCAFNAGKQAKWIENVCEMRDIGKTSRRRWTLEMVRSIRRWISVQADWKAEILCFSMLGIKERKMANKCTCGICGFVLVHNINGPIHFEGWEANWLGWDRKQTKIEEIWRERRRQSGGKKERKN